MMIGAGIIAMFATFVGCFILMPIVLALVQTSGWFVIVPERRCFVYMLFGKVLATITYTATAVALMAGVGLAAATAEWGWKPLVSLSGPKVSASHSFALLLATLGVYLLALLGIAAFGLLISTVTRNSAAAVVSTLMFALLMQLIGALPGTEPIRPYLLSNQFVAWHGLLRVPVDWAPISHAVWLCALYIIVPAAAAYFVFLRRDVAGD